MKSVRSSSSQRSLGNSQQSIKASECIQVCIRLRPLLRPQEDEEAWNISKKTQSIYSLIDQKQCLMNNNDVTENMSLKDRKRLIEAGTNQISFSFDNIEGPEARTQSIYNKMGKHIVKSVIEGYHGSILCYGQTTSGKTFTMLGQPENPGILPCCIRDIFSLMQKQSHEEEFNVWVSYMEIYNENINDLLAPQSQNLKIVEDPKWGTLVQGLKMQRVWNFEQAIVLMNYGEEHRIYRETSIHEHSSRSHTVFKIYLESISKDLNKGYQKTRYSSLNLVDLAGSERLSEIDNNPSTLGETGYINKSLFILANCINKLAEGKKQHIPYRDSKLTRILSQALGGNSLTTIICCVSPAVCNFNQTLSTLRFAIRAKIIQNKPIINELPNYQQDNPSISFQEYKKLENNLDQQMKENISLSEQNFQLKNEITVLQGRMDNMSFELSELMNSVSLERKRSELEFGGHQSKTKINSIGSESNISNGGKQQSQQQQQKNQNIDSNFLDHAISQINPMIQNALLMKSDDISHEMEYFNIESNKLNQLYKKEVYLLQNKFIEGIKQIVFQICQEEKQFKPINSFVETLSTLNSIGQQNWDFTKKNDNNKKQQNSKNQENELFNRYEELPLKQQNINNQLNQQQISQDKQNNNNKMLEKQQKININEQEYIINEQQQDEIILKGQYLLQKIENKEIFNHIKYSFMDIINQMELKECSNSQIGQLFASALKNQYDSISMQFDETYENSRNQLEFYYRRQISNIKNQKISGINSISLLQELTQEHENKLTSLRHLYEEEKNNLEQAFLATVRQIDDHFIKFSSHDNYQQQQQQQLQQYSSDELHKMEFYKSNHNSFNNNNNNNNYNDENQTENSLHYDSSSSINQSNLSNKNSLYNKKDNSLLQSNFNQMDLSKNKLPSNSFFKTPKFDLTKQIDNQEILKNQRSNVNGIIYIWGSGKDGRLGIDEEKPQKFPTIIQNLKVSQISLGYHHSAAITQQGVIITWGRGNRGQLGHSTFENQYIPIPLNISNHIEFVQVACGWQHTLGLTSDGQVFSWGFGEDGQLGQGDFQTINSPQKIKALDGFFINQIYAGHSHSSVVTSQGILMMFGCNVDHRLMNRTNENYYLPCITELEFLRQEYGSDYEVTSASLGVNHSAVITRNGNLYTGGLGNDGQLGSYISEDLQNSLLIPKSQQQDNSESSSKQEEDNNDQDQFDRICYFNKVKFFHKKNKAIAVSCGDSFSLVVNEQNQVFSFGKGTYNRLGHCDIPNNQNVYEPKLIETLKNQKITSISTGCRHAIAITNEGKVYSWGFNFYDQLGLGDSDKDYQKPTKITKLGGLNVKQSSCGYFHTAVIVN